MNNSIQHRLREALTARGMTPAELAKTIGVGNGYISQLLSGFISQPKKNLPAICQALRVREQWMLTGEGPTDIQEKLHELKKVPVKNTNVPKHIECARLENKSDLEAYILPPSSLFSTSYYAIVEKTFNGSGMFLIEHKGNFYMSIRKDSFISVEWQHLTEEKIPNEEFSAIGKVVQLLEINNGEEDD
ncbi:helix-turn-helix transcriptional regulator [Serratia marcescens]|uniref:helix-turn-helix domain-containing protein n=1 Tax=Serratia TaxID=613 RepID=UPI0019D266A1|nr:helix-turn-helix transcriptional regulator [Serratia ureilytica]ELQ9312075.1 helix-turn-helix transcriptional regulator [Serratia marcescens]ELQ9442212.1 helix-turn-helix transcriptional regulator [Serratia marcescens]ELT5562972.1 helix-turn-helix transcriptional regulator [Serratia marcescens]MBN5215691.1 helix-turn-helix transcriptional regulator [Serratia ureilytica]